MLGKAMTIKVRVAKYSSLAAVAILGFASLPAHAKSWEFDNGVNLDWDTTITYGAQWRMQNRKNSLVNPSNKLLTIQEAIDNDFLINTDDGNRNFDKGDLTANRLSILTEMDISYKDYGFFLRAKMYYDDVYNSGSATNNDTYFTNNQNERYGFSDGDVGEFADKTKDLLGFDGRILDAFFYGSFAIGERSLNLRVGRQVINWGEALLSGGGVSSGINHVDAYVRNTPGLEIKELFLPNGAIYGQLDLTDKLSIEAYYQYEWQPNILDPSGSYFSEFDILGTNAPFIIFTGAEEEILQVFGIPLPGPLIHSVSCGSTTCPSVATRLDTTEARDDGQYGISFRYLMDNGTELGFYHLNYHDKVFSFYLPLGALVEIDFTNSLEVLSNLPNLLGDLAEGFTYDLRYAEDIKLWGASFSTVLGVSNVGGEITYRENVPLLGPDLTRTPERNKVIQAQVNMIHLFGPSWLADSVQFTGEVVAWYVPDRDNDTLAVQNTAGGYGYSFLTTLQYKNVMQGVDLDIPIYFNHGVDGAMFTSGFREDQMTLSVGATFKYLSSFQASIAYATYFGSKKDQFQRLTTDRDNLSVSFKYTF